ncbi:hypothetical protein B0H11DRAFT_2233492 [Mycena galericulata]|nr:hypothetical protein B0H11DRAFT_2233492 [Mycena galericulata]
MSVNGGISGGASKIPYLGHPNLLMLRAIGADVEARKRTRRLQRVFALKEIRYAHTLQERAAAHAKLQQNLEREAAEQRRDGARLQRLVTLEAGMRTQRGRSLKRRDLWLTEARPPQHPRCKAHHLCELCDNLKSHPVSYLCGHSHCYVCICVSLERSWQCPVCGVPMQNAPFRHVGEEQSIASDYPHLLDASAVDYSWDGLRFPRELAEGASTA